MNATIPIISLSFLSALTPLTAGEHPNWSDLEALFGKHIKSKQVLTFVERYKLSKWQKGDPGSFKPNDGAYVLRFKSDRIWAISIRVSDWGTHGEDHWKAYDRKLPANLERGDRRREFEEKLEKVPGLDGNRWVSGKLRFSGVFHDKSGVMVYLHVLLAPAKSTIQPAQGPPDGAKEFYWKYNKDYPGLSLPSFKLANSRISEGVQRMQRGAVHYPTEKPLTTIQQGYKRLLNTQSFLGDNVPKVGMTYKQYFVFTLFPDDAATDAFKRGWAVRKSDGMVFRWLAK